MAAEIKDTFQVVPELIPGRGGIFDVAVNGQLVFSKHDVGRFPHDHEVLDLLSKHT